MATKRELSTSGYKVMLVDIHTKSDDGEQLADGEFVGYAAVFNNKDSHGDVIRPGAFLKSLGGYGENGAGVPAYWSHRMDDPMMNIGVTKTAREDERGLRVHVKLDTENPNGAQALKLVKEGRVKQMSFAYTIKDYAWGESEEMGEYFELKELDLHEVSLVPIGANQETELLSVKAHSGGVSNEDLALALKSFGARLDEIAILVGAKTATEGGEIEVPADEGKEDKTEEPAPAKVEDLTEVKSEALNPNMTTVSALLAIAGI